MDTRIVLKSDEIEAVFDQSRLSQLISLLGGKTFPFIAGFCCFSPCESEER